MQDETFEQRLARVRDRIEAACRRAGRDIAEVELVAVSKTHGPESIREAAECGLMIFGESKVQEARQKISQCPGHLRWHLIGHLQTNKAKLAVQLFDVVHSVDSVRVLRALHEACDQRGRQVEVYLEVNVSGESSKYGLAPDDLPSTLEVASECHRLDVLGLMTMPPFAEDPEKARAYFARLRDLRERCRSEWSFPVDGLSMGMSHDFEVAIEEGSTCVRVGSDLFGARRGR